MLQTVKCKLVSSGIRVIPAIEDDYRQIIKFLIAHGLEFYTYPLRSEKQLRVVIRGVMQESSKEEMRLDILQRGYSAGKFSRIKGRKGLNYHMRFRCMKCGDEHSAHTARNQRQHILNAQTVKGNTSQHI